MCTGTLSRVARTRRGLSVSTRAMIACDERHHVEQDAVRFAAVEEREEIRMLKVRRDADFAQKALDAEHRAELGVEHLDGDTPLVAEIAGEVDGRHPASADLTLDQI